MLSVRLMIDRLVVEGLLPMVSSGSCVMYLTAGVVVC